MVLPPLLALLLLLLGNVSSGESNVIGCGGKIRSDHLPGKIDLTQINIGLLTEHGSLKDTTDCAPSNGYFFIPIYDLAKYKIKVG